MKDTVKKAAVALRNSHERLHEESEKKEPEETSATAKAPDSRSPQDQFRDDTEAREEKEFAEKVEVVTASYAGRGLALWRRKLFTKEDPMNLHKTLGLLCLSSYIYRYFFVWPRTGSLGFIDGSVFDWLTVCVHCALSCSGMIFRVPSRRIRKLPTTIWEEYRQHAALFTLRSLIVFTMVQLLPSAGALPRFIAALSVHFAADNVTDKWGTPGETSVRGRDGTSRWHVWALRRVYASYQFIAIASQLLPHARSADLAYNTVIAIQSSAFLMTLRRKGLVRWQSHAVWYTFCLILSTGYILQATSSWTFVVGVAIVFTLRTQLRLNKYLLWLVFAILAAQPPLSAWNGLPNVTTLWHIDSLPAYFWA